MDRITEQFVTLEQARIGVDELPKRAERLGDHGRDGRQVGARVEQCFQDDRITFLRERVHAVGREGRLPVRAGRVGVRARVEQCRHGVRSIVAHGPEQRGATMRVSGVDGLTGLDERFAARNVAQRRERAEVDRGAGAAEQCNHVVRRFRFEWTGVHGAIEWLLTVGVLRIHVWAGLDKGLGQIERTAFGSEVQGRCAFVVAG